MILLFRIPRNPRAGQFPQEIVLGKARLSLSQKNKHIKVLKLATEQTHT